MTFLSLLWDCLSAKSFIATVISIGIDAVANQVDITSMAKERMIWKCFCVPAETIRKVMFLLKHTRQMLKEIGGGDVLKYYLL